MESMHKLKDLICRELDEFARKDELETWELETIHKLTDTIKNIDKIMMLEDEDGGYSQNRGYPYGKDIMYDDGSSYARRGRHYVRGHYSRDDGRDRMMHHLEGMMAEAGNEREREAISRCIDQLRGM